MNLNNIFSGMGSLTTIIVTVPFLIIGLVFIVAGIRSYARLNTAKRNWHPTQGRIMFSEVIARRSSSGRGGTSTSYYPRVVYEYVVNGNRYQGTQVSVGHEVGYGSYQMVNQRVMQNYPPGRDLSVYYNPANPSEAALEFGAPRGGLFIFIGVVVLVLSIVPLLFTAGGMGLLNQFLSSLSTGN